MTHMERRLEALKALTTEEEQKEIKAVTQLRLRYRGKQYWNAEHTKYDRIWDVLSPVPGYTTSGVPTFTLAGLKEKGLIAERTTEGRI